MKGLESKSAQTRFFAAYGFTNAEFTMPGDPKESRAHALHCRELAETSTTLEARQKLLELAAKWDELAAQLEATKSLLTALQDIESRQTSELASVEAA